MTVPPRLTFICLGLYTGLYWAAYAATSPAPASAIPLLCAAVLHAVLAIPGTTALSAPIWALLRNRPRRAIPARPRPSAGPSLAAA